MISQGHVRLTVAASLLAMWLSLAALGMAQAPALAKAPDTIQQPATQGLPPTRLSLQAATDLLIKNNLPLIAARYSVDALRAQRIAAGLRPNPTATVSATQFTIPRVFEQPGSAIKTNTDNGAANTTYTLEIDQLIERGGKRDLRARQAELNTSASEALVQDTLRQQLFQLHQAFFNAVLARENLHVARENQDTFGHTEQLLVTQVREGYSAGVDLKRVQLQQLQFQRDVATAEQGYQQAVRDVLNVIGAGDAPSPAGVALLVDATGADRGHDLTQGNLDITPTLLWIDELRSQALTNRPDIKAAELTVEAAKAGVELAKAQRVRDVTLGGQYSRNGSDNTVGGVVGIPLSIGPRANTQIAQATAVQLQAEAQLRQTKTQALTDVEKAFTAYRASLDRLRLFTGSALNTAADVQRIEEISYREGAKGLLDYLDAQRTYNQTLIDYNQARFDYLMSLYQLEFATGTQIVK